MVKKYCKGRVGVADCVYNGKKNHAKIRVGPEQRIVFTTVKKQKTKKPRKNEGRRMSALTKIHSSKRIFPWN